MPPTLSRLAAAILAGFILSAGSAWTAPPAGAHAADASEVKLIPHEKTVDVEIGGQPFTTYHFADDFILPYVRPFLWPVRASDGTEVTLDQAQFRDLHPHQRSIWIGHKDVNGANHWNIATKPLQPKQRNIGTMKAAGDTLQHELLWEDKDGKPMLNEVRTLRFMGFPDASRGIDLTLRFTPVEGDVTFADAKDAGLCCVRMPPALTSHAQLTNSAGGKTEADCWAKPADWCDESGPLNGKLYGAAILDHPSNPRHPPLWHAHIDTRLSPDIFGLHQMDKKKYPKGAGDFTIHKDQPVTFRYRIIIHTGDAASAHLAEKYKQYAQDK